MNSIEWGIVIAVCVGALGYLVSVELRIRSVQSQLIQSNQKVKDDAITDSVRASSDADLDANLAKNLGGAATGTGTAKT